MTTTVDYQAAGQDGSSSAEEDRRQPSSPDMDAVLANLAKNPEALASLIGGDTSAPRNVIEGRVDYEKWEQVPTSSYVNWQDISVLNEIVVNEIEAVDVKSDKYPPRDGRKFYFRYYCVEVETGKERIIDNKKKSMMRPLAQLNVQTADRLRVERLSKGGPGTPYRFRIAQLDDQGNETQSAEG